MADRAARITGASSGIGLAIAHMLGEEGHGLTVAARRPEKLAGAAQELRDAGYEVEEVAANMSSEEEIQNVVAEAVRFALHVSTYCVIPEIIFQRPGETV
jgi:short-subunit dehydrogenase